MRQVTDYTVEDTSAARLRAGDEGLSAFLEAGYGLSMHWGLYSTNGRGEWVMFKESIPLKKYRRRMEVWNPSRFNAEEWADLMLETGAKFLLITTKHHDGFSLWDTALSDFKVTKTPFGRDVLAELVPALQDRGLGLCYYYSLLDWTQGSYRSDWPAYVEYYQGQLRELFTNYGKIGAIVFDGYWPRFEFNEGNAHFAAGGSWDLAGTYDLIHGLQPQCVVFNNHHVLPLKGEDAQVWELDMPGENTAGFNTTEVGDKAKVVWWNLNSGWAYAPRAHNVKSPAEIAAALNKAQEHGAAFMLNVGPRPFGDVHPDEARALREIGRLVREHGDS